MQPQPTPTHDSAAGLTPGTIHPTIRASAPWSVVSLEVLPNYRLKVSFCDGTSGMADISRLIDNPNAGVFSQLANRELFAQAYISHGAVTWPGELDIAPDTMHQAIQRHGEWVA